MTRVSGNSSPNDGQNDEDIQNPRDGVEDISKSFDDSMSVVELMHGPEDLTWTRTIKGREARFIVQVRHENENRDLARSWKRKDNQPSGSDRLNTRT